MGAKRVICGVEIDQPLLTALLLIGGFLMLGVGLIEENEVLIIPGFFLVFATVVSGSGFLRHWCGWGETGSAQPPRRASMPSITLP